MTIPERFWSKVIRNNGCWIWTAHRDKAGYARFGMGRNVLYAHRYIYEQTIGPIPQGMVIDHKCRNRGCVNPDHLHTVTHAQNHQNTDGANALNKSSGLRNVYLHKHSGLWYVRVGHMGKSYHRGYFATPELANDAALELRNQLYTNNLKDREDTAA